MHFCTAKVAITGDLNNVMVRGSFQPISWPELEILRTLHGEESVTDVEPFVRVPQPPKAERERLSLIYGNDVLTHIWGGTRPPHEMEDPSGAEVPGMPWFNPITQEVTKVPALEEEPLFVDTPPKVAGKK